MKLPWGYSIQRLRGAACILAASLCLAFAAGSAHAQTSDNTALERQVDTLKSQLNDLRQQLRNLRAELRAGSGPRARKISQEEIPPTVAARFEVRMSQLERAITKLTGKIEDLSFSVRKTRKDVKKLENDYEYRINKLERGGTSASGTAKATTNRVEPPRRRAATGAPRDRDDSATTGILPEGTAKQQYTFAYRLMRQRKGDEAIQAFKEFVAKHPRSPLAGNAYHWLGQLYFDRKRYSNAAQNFAAGYQKFRRHSRAADNLLFLGVSLARLKKRNLACQSFAELRSNFPNAYPDVRRRARIERRKLGCR